MSESPMKPLIVLYLPQEWHDYVRRPHWTAVGRLLPVLAVEPPAPLLLGSDRQARREARRTNGPRPRRSPDGLYLFRPKSIGSFGAGARIPLIGKLDALSLSRQVRIAIDQYSTQVLCNHVIHVFVKPQQHHLAAKSSGDLFVYESTDDSRVLPEQSTVDPDHPHAKLLTQWDRRLVSLVDLLIVSSEALLNSRSFEHGNVRYLPNCADVSHFAAALDGSTPIPDDIATIPAPHLGYVGGVNELVDLRLLKNLATANPDWSIVLIGGVRGGKQFVNSAELNDLRSLPNVHFMGHRPYEVLPAYVKSLDVCLSPFVLNPWMIASSPNKTFQYLAAGKPVVSTDFPEARRVSDVIRIARNADEFISYCHDSLSDRGEDTRAKRIKIAHANSTEVRATKLVKLILKELEARPRVAD